MKIIYWLTFPFVFCLGLLLYVLNGVLKRIIALSNWIIWRIYDWEYFALDVKKTQRDEEEETLNEHIGW